MQHENDPRPVEVEPAARERRGLGPLIKVGAVFGVLAGVIGWLLFGTDASDALVYSKLVEEVLDKPSDFRGRELRVEGDLKLGSIKFQEDPCEYRFTIGKEGREMDVQFPRCIVPDTFRDQPGLKVTVQGKLVDDNTFLASQVIPKCPSKYEMEERAKKGELMPHGTPSKAGQLPMPTEGLTLPTSKGPG
jgi:cytochrome c-type biogenesis protein CcmE